MSRPQHQRKQVYVSRAIQGRIVSKLAIYWATYHLALWHAMFLFHYFLYRGQLMANPQMTAIPFVMQYTQFLAQHYSMLICAAAVFPLIFWDMMKVTHRVAGPLVRFENTLKQLERGEKVRPVTLREGDMLTEYRDSFNSYLEKAGLLLDDETAAEQPGEEEVLTELRDLSENVDDTNTSADESPAENEDLQPATVGS
jgi:large-conductance mechanosensitive channel